MISVSMLLWSGARCWIRTKDISRYLSAGRPLKNASNAANPPAEAPIPTTGNCRSDLECFSFPALSSIFLTPGSVGAMTVLASGGLLSDFAALLLRMLICASCRHKTHSVIIFISYIQNKYYIFETIMSNLFYSLFLHKKSHKLIG